MSVKETKKEIKKLSDELNKYISNKKFTDKVLDSILSNQEKALNIISDIKNNIGIDDESLDYKKYVEKEKSYIILSSGRYIQVDYTYEELKKIMQNKDRFIELKMSGKKIYIKSEDIEVSM